MPLIRNSLAEASHNRTSLPKNNATETAGSIIETIKGTLSIGEDILISGFGKFEVKEKG